VDQENMAKKKTQNPIKRKYPPFWEKFIPVALILITGIIAFLIFVIIRVALGLSALSF
jgi:hypothetical protein